MKKIYTCLITPHLDYLEYCVQLWTWSPVAAPELPTAVGAPSSSGLDMCARYLGNLGVRNRKA